MEKEITIKEFCEREKLDTKLTISRIIRNNKKWNKEK